MFLNKVNVSMLAFYLYFKFDNSKDFVLEYIYLNNLKNNHSKKKKRKEKKE